MRPLPGTRVVAPLVVTAATATACVDTFEGVDIQLTLDEGVGRAADSLGSAPPGQARPGTYFTLYAIDLAASAGGSRSFAHEISRFEIVPVVAPASPCFIEIPNLEARTFAGLHVTQLVEKLRDETGIADALNPPPGASPGDVIDILTAERRLGFVPQIHAQLRAVVAPSLARGPEVDTGCAGDGSDTSPDLVPPPRCIDDASNERRLALCQEFWDRNPEQYEGSDRAYTDPLNGTFYGLVDGVNPINSAPLGGIELLLDVDWEGFDQIAVNWQYEDSDEDGEPDYPDDLPEAQRSILGFHFLEGNAFDIKRGVTTYPLRNRNFSAISGEATVLFNLGEDDVHF